MLFRTKKQLFHCKAHFRQKWTHGAGRRRTPKISRPAGQDFGPADMGGGWGPAKFLGRQSMVLAGFLSEGFGTDMRDRGWVHVRAFPHGFVTEG